MACEIEVHLSDAEKPAQAIVGLPDAAVRESIRRVWAAIYNSGFPIPRAFATINLAPATVRKEGPVYDLPIALGVLQAGRTIRDQLTWNYVSNTTTCLSPTSSGEPPVCQTSTTTARLASLTS